MSHQFMHINITGPAGAGKTTAMHIIGQHLRQVGFNLSCYDAPEPYSDKGPQREEPWDMTGWFSERTPQDWPVLITVEGGGIEYPIQLGAGHNTLANAYRRLVAGAGQAAQVPVVSLPGSHWRGRRR